MTGICAIYSGFAQSRQSILSLTSTLIRGSSQIHVRRNSVLACAYDKSIVSPVNKVRAATSILNANHFGGALTTVSFSKKYHQFFITKAKKIRKKSKKKIEQLRVSSGLSVHRNLLNKTGTLGNILNSSFNRVFRSLCLNILEKKKLQ